MNLYTPLHRHLASSPFPGSPFGPTSPLSPGTPFVPAVENGKVMSILVNYLSFKTVFFYMKRLRLLPFDPIWPFTPASPIPPWSPVSPDVPISPFTPTTPGSPLAPLSPTAPRTPLEPYTTVNSTTHLNTFKATPCEIPSLTWKIVSLQHPCQTKNLCALFFFLSIALTIKENQKYPVTHWRYLCVFNIIFVIFLA